MDDESGESMEPMGEVPLVGLGVRIGEISASLLTVIKRPKQTTAKWFQL